ncbi:helix-turn-helix domain-containing protein [Algoriphagus sp.]|uniref:helix-turn-helix domain-containing protein n=1 Tax=Algoriphagus sp. TaxID=1872435 RepID=UPI003F72984E
MELKFEDLPEAVSQLIEQNKLILKLMQEANFPKENDEEVLTLTRICELLELKRQTIYSYVSKKQIPYHKKAGKLYFFRKEILAWVKTETKKRIVDRPLLKLERKYTVRKLKKP